MVYRLVQPDGKRKDSATPGKLGGNMTLKIYGQLDCARAIAALAQGYAKHRVFFADEAAAIAAGYRPCGRCMLEQYTVWKAGPNSGADYPWHSPPHHPLNP